MKELFHLKNNWIWQGYGYAAIWEIQVPGLYVNCIRNNFLIIYIIEDLQGQKCFEINLVTFKKSGLRPQNIHEMLFGISSQSTRLKDFSKYHVKCGNYPIWLENEVYFRLRCFSINVFKLQCWCQTICSKLLE